MIRTGWNATAQLLLDDLASGCHLLVCRHSTQSWDIHASIWQTETGTLIRTGMEGVANRLINDGFVVEVSRAPVVGGCSRGAYGRQVPAWQAIYRLAREDEDARACALHNQKRDFLYLLCQEMQRHGETMAHLIGTSSPTLPEIHAHLEAVTSLAMTALLEKPTPSETHREVQ